MSVALNSLCIPRNTAAIVVDARETRKFESRTIASKRSIQCKEALISSELRKQGLEAARACICVYMYMCSSNACIK